MTIAARRQVTKRGNLKPNSLRASLANQPTIIAAWSARMAPIKVM